MLLENVLRTLLAKRFPWDAALTIDAVLQHINKPPVPLSTLLPTVDKQVAAAIMKGLEANPDDRWQTVSEMVSEIREAEIRMVKAARDAAAAKAKASGVPLAPIEPTTEKKKDTSSMPASSATSKSDAPSDGNKEKRSSSDAGAQKAAKARSKKRNSDDDVDLDAMFSD